MPAFRDAFQSRRCLIMADDPWQHLPAGHGTFHLPACGPQFQSRHHQLLYCHRAGGQPMRTCPIGDRSFSIRFTMMLGWARRLRRKDILSHDMKGQLQCNRVGREINATVANKLPSITMPSWGRPNRSERRTAEVCGRHDAGASRAGADPKHFCEHADCGKGAPRFASRIDIQRSQIIAAARCTKPVSELCVGRSAWRIYGSV